MVKVMFSHRHNDGIEMCDGIHEKNDCFML